MGSKLGVIDLGSNTFHILIVNRNRDGSFEILFKERAFVGLAEDGIKKLSDQAMERGLAALVNFSASLKQYDISQYSVIGTSALRSASNSSVFCQLVKERLGLEIEIIDGKREAELIFKGVSKLMVSYDEPQIIMDVGGGSVEFILVENDELIWSASYDVGVGVLHNHIILSDPCTKEDIDEINKFINQELSSLEAIISNKPIGAIIGASGSFEVIQSMNGAEVSSNSMTEVRLGDFHSISQKIISSTFADRMKMDGLPKSRVKLTVVAMILISRAIEIIKPKRLLVSPFALKEGVLIELTTN
ncbi:MAG: exopolyphosphatase/guanosine-5'-triphosphate,3'-diphosphate pyrophosphatase [Saprospiraceae bacterium]|jgi:exopolyphosphatase/guanosine-5'-triphosphate,3'-diphosphate pyrophosphatase|tara:strand:+ start:57 stop:965 length:909 start_codon:yes stop_codon:yes gene_type:complete